MEMKINLLKASSGVFCLVILLASFVPSSPAQAGGKTDWFPPGYIPTDMERKEMDRSNQASGRRYMEEHMLRMPDSVDRKFEEEGQKASNIFVSSTDVDSSRSIVTKITVTGNAAEAIWNGLSDVRAEGTHEKMYKNSKTVVCSSTLILDRRYKNFSYLCELRLTSDGSSAED